jgi:hypothetical protein
MFRSKGKSALRRVFRVGLEFEGAIHFGWGQLSVGIVLNGDEIRFVEGNKFRYNKALTPSPKYLSTKANAFLYTSSFSWFCSASKRSKPPTSSTSKHRLSMPPIFSASWKMLVRPCNTTCRMRASFDSNRSQ